ncbi:hypothetical protein [uncultured Aquimarina sp.]|uniref:hypothetical protein n=1 Tax=uncultured Aquimarina sp. TaxID=575652 RepID=UPI002623C34E|nr:hypothetical protein [uncultured Aquimarina sp.]
METKPLRIVYDHKREYSENSSKRNKRIIEFSIWSLKKIRTLIDHYLKELEQWGSGAGEAIRR